MDLRPHSLTAEAPQVARSGAEAGAAGTVIPVSEALSGARALAVWADALDELMEATRAPLAAWSTALDVWFRHHPEHKPWAVIVRSGQRVDAAIVLSRRLSFGVWLMGRPGESGCVAARDGAAARALADAVNAALRGLRLPWMLRVSSLQAPCPVLDALRPSLRISHVAAGPVAVQQRFESAETLHTYLSRNNRSAAAKARNRIKREGHHLDIAWTDDADEIERCLPAVFGVHRSRNIQLRGVAGIDDPATAALVASMIRTHAERRRTWLLTVRIDRELAAFAVCFVAGGTLWVYSNMAAPAWLRYSPGTIANTEVVKRAYGDPSIHTLDWGAGIQRYKLSGKTALRESQQIHAWSSHWTRWMWTVREWLRHRLYRH